MKFQPAVETDSTPVVVLSVSPDPDDHRKLGSFIAHSRWKLLTADNLPATVNLLRVHDIGVLLCDRDLPDATWVDVLNHLNTLPNSPALIVTSRLADERLWAEALNLGAWDVLAKPLERTEVLRGIRYAWEHYRRKGVESAPKLMRAAG
jgi:DNA-binding response OmpR family regulator